MPRLERLPQIVRNTLLNFPAQVNDTTPFNPLERPLSKCRLAIVTTAGLHLRGDRLFSPADQTFRVIPSGVNLDGILQSHTSLGYDRVATIRDINITFPIDRLKELAAQGEIGELGPNCYSFMGAQHNVGRIEAESGPAVAHRLRGENVDAVLITPTWPLCSHTGGVLARVLESNGIATVCISFVREHSEKVKPPRTLWVPFPFGHAMGRPNNPEFQHRVLRSALDLLGEPAGPVLRDFSDDSQLDDVPAAPIQASAIISAGTVPLDPANEMTQMRIYHGQWLESNQGRTAFGLSGIPATRFRGVIRFLQAFADGKEADMPARHAEMPLPHFIRYCADDLKALYYEGHLAMKPADRGEDLARWFWGETAAGQLLRRVRDRLDASDDPKCKAAAFGIAR